NPLVKTAAGDIVALDGKVTLDENADFRQPGHAALEDASAVDPLEQAAKEKNLNYVKLDGQVGIIGNGAGLVMSTLDVVAYAGENHNNVKPANFLDIGGGASAEVMANGLEIILGDPDVKSVFVNVFGGITACDEVAKGIVQALELLKSKGEDVSKPLVVRLDGNNAELGRQILSEANHPLVQRVDTMDDAVDKAAVVEAIHAEIPLAVVITECIAVHDSAAFWAYAKSKGNKTRIIGPNCPGLITPGQSNAGIIPGDITKPGRIGLVSKSGTL